jgi:hypothetical protein
MDCIAGREGRAHREKRDRMSPPVAASQPLSEEQIERYARQIIVPGIGAEGQKTLCAAEIFVDGHAAGRTVAAQYLRAAGMRVPEATNPAKGSKHFRLRLRWSHGTQWSAAGSTAGSPMQRTLFGFPSSKPADSLPCTPTSSTTSPVPTSQPRRSLRFSDGSRRGTVTFSRSPDRGSAHARNVH